MLFKDAQSFKKFFWGGYLVLWETLGGGGVRVHYFRVLIAFLLSNFLESFERVHEAQPLPPAPLPLRLYNVVFLYNLAF